MSKFRNLFFINSLLCLSLLILSSCTSSLNATSEINTPFPVLISSITPPPSSTPTVSTLSPTVTAYNFPQWIKNSDTAILAALIRDDLGKPRGISFFNATTGEKFELEMPTALGGFFWYDNAHFGFLSDDFQVMNLLNLSNGQVIKINLTSKSTRLLAINGSINPLVIKQDPLSPSTSLFDYAFNYWGSPYSIDTRYFAESIGSNFENYIKVTDLETGQIIWQSNPSDGYVDVHFLWSPVKNSHLAVVMGSLSETGFELPINNTMLIVVDIKTGEIITSHKVDAGRIQWSPDGTKILYRDAMSDYWNFGYGFTKAPCFLNIETRKESCFWRIPNHPPPDGYTLITTDDYQWSSDGKSFYFTYSYRSTNGMIGNICNYNLASGNLICPTDNLTEFPEWNIDWRYGWIISTYSLSPDGKNISFCLDSDSPLSDAQGGPSQNGLIETNGTNFTTWVNSEDALTRCSFYSPLWRPLP